MKTIYKYTLSTETELELPIGAKPLCVQQQRAVPQLWCVVDTDAPTETRYFNVYGTGHELPANPGEYIDTFQLSGGTLVFHVFEKKKH